MKRITLYYLVGILVLMALPLLNAQPTYRSNTPITVNVPCTNNGTSCSDSAVCLGTIIDPDGILVINNETLTQNSGVFYISLNASNVEEIGEYELTIACVDGTLSNSNTLPFYVTPNGQEVSEGKAFFYIGSIGVLIFFIIFSIIGFRNTEELWLKTLCFYIMWGSFLAMNYIAWVGSLNYLYSISFAGSFFKWLFYIQFYATFPLVLGSFLYCIYNLIMNKHMKNMLEHGVPEEKAMERSMKRTSSYFSRGGYKPKHY